MLANPVLCQACPTGTTLAAGTQLRGGSGEKQPLLSRSPSPRPSAGTGRELMEPAAHPATSPAAVSMATPRRRSRLRHRDTLPLLSLVPEPRPAAGPGSGPDHRVALKVGRRSPRWRVGCGRAGREAVADRGLSGRHRRKRPQAQVSAGGWAASGRWVGTATPGTAASGRCPRRFGPALPCPAQTAAPAGPVARVRARPGLEPSSGGVCIVHGPSGLALASLCSDTAFWSCSVRRGEAYRVGTPRSR